MDHDKQLFLDELARDFDLERIKSLSLFEKFKFDNYATLVYHEALFASKEGLEKLDKSPNYTKNKTYTLFAMLAVNGTSYELIREIILNYAKCFEKSDTYYSKISIIGIGVMMIMKGFTPDAIFNYLMLLLGRDFLMENKKYSGCPADYDHAALELESGIVYKPYEGELRNLKYDMLALLKFSLDQGVEAASEVIQSRYGNDELKFFFNMMDVKTPEVQDLIFNELKTSRSRHRRILINGAYAILRGLDVVSTHYLFNSIIGKYSRYDKNSGEIESEVQSRLDVMLKRTV